MTSPIDPEAPDAAKNICMNKMPTAAPAVRILEKNLGNAVADITVRIDVSGSDDVPFGKRSFVRIPPRVTRQDETATETPMEGIVISLLLLDEPMLSGS
mmetsp:Transcript_39922/g.60337  ORF Transcript_39922/g.60337 Transcript_39922/m.60337 type:complete len:99 (-) Transcript_39922:1204-1500(-)